MKKEIPFIISTLFALTRWCLEALEGGYNYTLGSGDKLLNAISWAFAFTGCAAMFVGAGNLFRIHGNNIRRKRPYWEFSAYLLAVLVYQSIVGLIQTQTGTLYLWSYNAILLPLDATMFSLLAFYIASASYRAFRIRNLDGAIMMVCALLLMLGNVPIGEVIWSSTGPLGGFAGVKNWILRVPNAAGARVINFGIFLGVMATQSRILLGIERRHLGAD